MTPRSAEVLHSIVRIYIETGQPVASKTISKNRKGGWLSPATIRSLMAELSEEGYLSQPHTSAGRVPTEKAFRHFVDALTARRLRGADMSKLHAAFSGAESLEAWAERSSHVLTTLTRNMGIAVAFPPSARELDQIELLRLGDRRVLVIVVTRDRVVRTRALELEEFIPESELASIRNYVNWHFSGWALPEARRELERRLRQESAAYDTLLRRLSLFYNWGLLDVDFAPEVYMDGTFNLVGLDFHLTRKRMKELFQALEQKKRLLEILDRFLEHPQGELSVQIGLGEAHPSMKGLSLIGLSVPSADNQTAKIAVLGPMRMNYERAISAVFHVGEAMRSGLC